MGTEQQASQTVDGALAELFAKDSLPQLLIADKRVGTGKLLADAGFIADQLIELGRGEE